MFLFKVLGFTLNLFLPKGILAPLQVSHNDKIMAVHLDSIARKESTRTKPSHLPLLSLGRSVQLFPAHLTQVATFANDAPDLTPSQLMQFFDHGNTHTKTSHKRLVNQLLPRAPSPMPFLISPKSPKNLFPHTSYIRTCFI